MILKYVVVLLFLQVNLSICHQGFMRKMRQAFPQKFSPFDLTGNHQMGIKRNRRCLGTTLSLLWPQVVGPVEQGVIMESGYDKVPKTLLEHRLELIRKKAKEEEESRLMVREYLKKLTEAQDEFYGYPPYGNSVTDYT